MPPTKQTRRGFTEEARLAAAAARRRIKEERLAAGPHRPAVFVVRHRDGALLFGWQIRRFGGLVLDQSGAAFPSMFAARAAGERALSGGAERSR